MGSVDLYEIDCVLWLARFTYNSTGADILPTQIALSLLRMRLGRTANRLRSSPWASGSPSPMVHWSAHTLHATMNQSVPKKVHHHKGRNQKKKRKVPLSGHPFSLANAIDVSTRRVRSALFWTHGARVDALRPACAS